MSRGVVLSRAVISLRSIETKPFDSQICPQWTDTSATRTASTCRASIRRLGACVRTFLYVRTYDQSSGGRAVCVRVFFSKIFQSPKMRAPLPLFYTHPLYTTSVHIKYIHIRVYTYIQPICNSPRLLYENVACSVRMCAVYFMHTSPTRAKVSRFTFYSIFLGR